MIATQGGLFGGWALYFEKGKPVFSYKFADGSNYRAVASGSPWAHESRLPSWYPFAPAGHFTLMVALLIFPPNALSPSL